MAERDDRAYPAPLPEKRSEHEIINSHRMRRARLEAAKLTRAGRAERMARAVTPPPKAPR